jgi:hypothetical protein
MDPDTNVVIYVAEILYFFYFLMIEDCLQMLQLRWLKKASMVKDDGTVEIDVPGNIKPRSPENGTGVLDPSDESCNETIIEDIQPIRPQQIAMLIVGTRGDVQPFVAIGKRLQVLFVLGFFGCTFYIVIIYLKNMCCTSLIFSMLEISNDFLWRKCIKVMKT